MGAALNEDLIRMKHQTGSVVFSRMRRSLIFAGVSAAMIALLAATVITLPEPYERSNYITDVKFDWSTFRELAPGSDIWPITWSDDDNMYTAFGDGGGFGGDNQLGRVALGVARISGDWDAYAGNNVWGGHNSIMDATFGGKSFGMISVKGVLYMWWAGDDSDIAGTQKWGDNTILNECRIAVSFDHGKSWTLDEKMFQKSDLLYCPTFLNFGKDNHGARDKYVYSYFPRLNNVNELWYDSAKTPQARRPGNVDLARVPRNHIRDKSYYEFFAGFDSRGKPQWTSDFSPGARQPVFVNKVGGVRTVSCTYNPGLKRYLLTTEHTRFGKANLGTVSIFEGEEPWGPWKTVLYGDNWGKEDGGLGRHIGNLNFFFAPRWFSKDGRDFTMVTTAGDSWGTVRGRFTIKD